MKQLGPLQGIALALALSFVLVGTFLLFFYLFVLAWPWTALVGLLLDAASIAVFIWGSRKRRRGSMDD